MSVYRRIGLTRALFVSAALAAFAPGAGAQSASGVVAEFDAVYSTLNDLRALVPKPTHGAGRPAAPPWRFEAMSPDARAHASAQIAGAVDDTDALIAAYSRAAAAPDAPAPASAAKTCFLLLRGMAYRLDREHFQAMSRRFAQRGVCAEVVDGPIDANFGQSAPRIAEAILRHENVVLIGHSKGGLNALETVSLAYRTNDSAVTSRVRAIVTLQTPFACAPTADLWLQIPGGLYHDLFDIDRWWTHGRKEIPSRDALDEVSCEERAHPSPLPLPPGIKLYSVATSFPVGEPGIVGSDAELRALYLKSRTGEDSDGYVTPDRGLVPGSRFALLDRLTHTDLVTSDAKVYGAKYWSVGKDADFATRLFPDALLDWISRN